MAGHNVVMNKESDHAKPLQTTPETVEVPSGQGKETGQDQEAKKEVVDPHWTMLPWPARLYALYHSGEVLEHRFVNEGEHDNR